MQFDPANSGIGEARIIKIQQIIQAELASLNAALARDAVTSGLIGPGFGGVLTPACVEIGMRQTIWERTESAIKIGVHSTAVGGPNAFGTFQKIYIGEGVSAGNYMTAIQVLFHPNAISLTDDNIQRARQETTSIRIADWMLGAVLNNYKYIALYMSSKTFTTTPSYDSLGNILGYDCLSPCYCTQAFVAPAKLGYGDNAKVTSALHFMHVGEIEA